MKQSNLFTKTIREAPEEEKSINANLLLRAGYVNKLTSGVYTYLPLGLRVLNNIENIIREEMNKIGGQEILMPALTPKDIWETRLLILIYSTTKVNPNFSVSAPLRLK